MRIYDQLDLRIRRYYASNRFKVPSHEVMDVNASQFILAIEQTSYPSQESFKAENSCELTIAYHTE